MPKISKFFRVAVEGATADGRTIERSHLVEMAASYNRDTYAARVNLEHIRGITADKPFRALGDVIALKTEEIELELNGKKEKKLALFAQIEPNDDLIQINGQKQKLYSSIEVNPNFANTGKAYLMGLAVTDSPASLGTEMLAFAAGQRAKGADPFAARRLAPDNVFVESVETAFDFVDSGQAASMSDEAKGFFSAATEFFKGLGIGAGGAPTPEPKPAAPAPTPPEKPANDNHAAFTALAAGIEKLTQGIQAMATDTGQRFAQANARIDQLAATIESTQKPDQFTRKPATGGNGTVRTDC